MLSTGLSPENKEFVALLRNGAGNLDIHDVEDKKHFAVEGAATDRWIEDELQRVALHQRRLCPLLERHAGHTPRILDVGCGTGGTTVALALSQVLAPLEVIGIDPNALSLKAAAVRARAHGLSSNRVHFRSSTPGQSLPFEDNSFDLVVCSSVLEYINRNVHRRGLIKELIRVTRPKGHVYVSTPNPLRLRDHHTKRLLGDWRHREGYPWATPPWTLRNMFKECSFVSLGSFYYELALDRLGRQSLPLPAKCFFWLPYVSTWQRILATKAGRP